MEHSSLEFSRKELVLSIENFLDKDEWNYEYDEKAKIFITGVALRSKLKSVKLYIACKETGISFDFFLKIGTDGTNVYQVMEFLTRANYGLVYGDFQLNMDVHDIVYHMFLPCESAPSYFLISSTIMTGLYTIDEYGDALLSVIFGMNTPKKAIEIREEQRKKKKID